MKQVELDTSQAVDNLYTHIMEAVGATNDVIFSTDNGYIAAKAQMINTKLLALLYEVKEVRTEVNKRKGRQ